MFPVDFENSKFVEAVASALQVEPSEVLCYVQQHLKAAPLAPQLPFEQDNGCLVFVQCAVKDESTLIHPARYVDWLQRTIETATVEVVPLLPG